MSEGLAEYAVIRDVCSLSAQMQKIYLQLMSAIDCSLMKLRYFGAQPEHISEEFIAELIDQLLDRSLSQQALQECINEELLRQIPLPSERGILEFL